MKIKMLEVKTHQIDNLNKIFSKLKYLNNQTIMMNIKMILFTLLLRNTINGLMMATFTLRQCSLNLDF